MSATAKMTLILIGYEMKDLKSVRWHHIIPEVADIYQYSRKHIYRRNNFAADCSTRALRHGEYADDFNVAHVTNMVKRVAKMSTMSSLLWDFNTICSLLETRILHEHG